ncbi:hypothetical protein [Nocardia higoensis]|uniref:hypothetical protein n=1 Tax=Nocardia higoensis TaxID=228599 RepID=UPI00030BB112|nr:hypothetical protein [Nocardia higoensis]
MKTALGVLNLDISRSPADDRHILTELAHARGYDLIDVLTIDESTYMPTAHIAERARSAGATALLAPSFEHFGVSARVLPLVAELVVPGRDEEPGRPLACVRTDPRQRPRARRVLAVVALIAFSVTAWVLRPAPDPTPPPTPAVVVLPDEPEGAGMGDR